MILLTFSLARWRRETKQSGTVRFLAMLALTWEGSVEQSELNWTPPPSDTPSPAPLPPAPLST